MEGWKVTRTQRHEHAVQRTHHGGKRRLVEAVVGGVVAVGLLAELGSPADVPPGLIVAAAAVVTAIIVPTAEYIWHFIRAPSSIRRQRLEGAVEALDDVRSDDHLFAERLLERYQHGVTKILNDSGIRMANRPAESAVQEWDERRREWQDSVLTLMREHGCSAVEMGHIQILGEVPVLSNYHRHPELDRRLRNEAERLRRIKRLTETYGAGR